MMAKQLIFNNVSKEEYKRLNQAYKKGKEDALEIYIDLMFNGLDKLKRIIKIWKKTKKIPKIK